MKFLFLLEFDLDIGLGHLKRSSSYAESLRLLGHHTTLLTKQSNILRSESENPYPSMDRVLRADYKSFADAAHIEAIRGTLMDERFDIVFVDSYELNDQLIREIQSHGAKVLEVADKPAHQGVDFVLDYGFDAAKAKHIEACSNTTTRFYLGPDFAPAPKDLEGFTKSLNSNGSILLSLGGGQRSSELVALSRALLKATSRHQVNILTAHASKGLVDWVNGQSRVSLVDGGLSLAQAAVGADMAVVSAGVSLVETMHVGLPSIGILMAENQVASSLNFPANRYATVIDIEDFLNRTRELVLDFLMDPDEKISAALSLRSILDGKGPSRLSSLLTGTAGRELTIRRASYQDLPTMLKWANDPLVRAGSFHRGAIAPKEHLDWYEGLENQGSEYLIGEVNGAPVGQVRLENIERDVLLSYSIDQNFRGLGLARQLIEGCLAISRSDRKIIAEVSSENLASIKILEALGFSGNARSSRGGLLLELH